VLEDIARFQALGVTNLVFRPGSMAHSVDTAQVCEQIEYIARSVLPQVQR
jgi:hypothetical protein